MLKLRKSGEYVHTTCQSNRQSKYSIAYCPQSIARKRHAFAYPRPFRREFLGNVS